MSTPSADSTLRKIRADALRPGMYLHKLCGSWISHPFWRTSFLIRDDAQIALIVDSGIVEVWIDLARGRAPDAADNVAVDAAARASPAGPETTEPETAATETTEPTTDAPATATAARRAGGAPLACTPIQDELLRARRICESSRKVVTRLFGEIRLGEAVRTDAAQEVVGEITESVARNPTALISVARLKVADDYTYMHSVAVCALMVALAQRMRLDAETTRKAGLGGLFHDLGKARIAPELLNKPGSLDEREFALIREHPRHGFDLLRESGFDDADVLDVVLHHHERFDGTGYPDRLVGEQTGVLARMGAICDVYDAITSDRPYKAGWDPAQSIHRMHSWKGHFDPVLMQHFVCSIGIYPLGALVRLESDHLGVVCEPSTSGLLRPVVRVFWTLRGKHQVPVHDVDLAAPNCCDRIVAVESPAAHGFRELERLWLP